jgi:hypothetical protein
VSVTVARPGRAQRLIREVHVVLRHTGDGDEGQERHLKPKAGHRVLRWKTLSTNHLGRSSSQAPEMIKLE